MKLVGILPARDEDWILGFSARAALKWMDELIVMNHASTDGTATLLQQIQTESGNRLIVLNQPNLDWMQYEYRQQMLTLARERGATHLACLDADEVLTADMLGKIRGCIESLPVAHCLAIPMRCLWGSASQYRTGEFRFSHYNLTAAWCDCPHIFWVADHGYQHDQREPRGLSATDLVETTSGIMHLQWVERRRLLAKHALYKMEHLVRWPDRWSPEQTEALYNQSPDETGLELSPVPPEWFTGYEDLVQNIGYGRIPWQEGECRRLYEQFGPEKFAGLNLWGIVP